MPLSWIQNSGRVGVGAVLLVTGLLISAAILWREYGTLDPRAAVRHAREVVGRRDAATT